MSSICFSAELSDPRKTIKPMCHRLGVAGLFAGIVWLVQTCGTNISATDAPWIIIGAMIAGAGAGFLLVAHADVV